MAELDSSGFGDLLAVAWRRARPSKVRQALDDVEQDEFLLLERDVA
ncbi:hypothetical protein NWF32_17165 [Pseudomonas qingdaonensis]|nr:hypothetical protein [Pseudomonas qingdaonensis]